MSRQHSPSEIPPSKALSHPVPEKPLIDIPEGEQWRLIKQTGIRDAANQRRKETSVEEQISLWDEIFNAVLLIIPFSSLLLLMEILIRHQYGKPADMESLMARIGPGVPALSIFIFYTIRYKQHRRMQMALFVLSCVVGSRLIYQHNKASWLVNMKQFPPLITLWVYTIVQLDLGPAVLSLITVASFVWWKGLEIK